MSNKDQEKTTAAPEVEQANPTVDDGDFGDSLFTLFANRAFLRTGDQVCRVAFGELLEDKTYWRYAITMTRSDLLSVGELILELLGPSTDQTDDEDAGKS